MKNEKKKLDNIDFKILNELQSNGSISNVELANIVNVSPPSCLRRVKSLENKNFIRGCNAILNPDHAQTIGTTRSISWRAISTRRSTTTLAQGPR